MFRESYFCFPIIFADGKLEHEHSNKIIMPISAMERLLAIEVSYPMQFRLNYEEKYTHVGVIEFTAEEGYCYIPNWIISMLKIPQGAIVDLINVELPVATFVKFKPVSMGILDHDDHKKLLEDNLRNFACLTVGDVITINEPIYNASGYVLKKYELEVIELKPSNQCSIIESDIETEFFVPPLPALPKLPLKEIKSKWKKTGMDKFPGNGNKLA